MNANKAIQALAAFEPGGELKPFTYDPGSLASDDVEIAVEYCGVCHSDLSMLDNAWGFTQYPFVPGHEVVGTVSEVGAKVTNFRVGQRVGLGWHSDYCMTCPTCVAGDHNLCTQVQATIIARRGGFADRVRCGASALVELPPEMDGQSAAPLFCGGSAVFNPLVQFSIQPTAQVAVIGIGGLGHLALQFLSAWGCEVTAFTSSADKKKQARAFGAHHTISSNDVSEIAAAAGRFDLVLSTVNVKLDWNAYLETLKPKGRLHFVGVTTEALDIGVMPLLNGQRSVSASPVGSPATASAMLDFVARHDIQPTIEAYNFTQVNEAMDRLRRGQARYRIVMNW